MPSWTYYLLIVLGFRLTLYLNRKGYFDRKARREEVSGDLLGGEVREGVSGDVPDRPVAFGNKTMWLTVPTTEPGRLGEELGVKGMEPCNWSMGIRRAYNEDAVFITPPVDGWCMVVGEGLPYPDVEEESKRLKALLERLSGVYGGAFCFGSYITVGMECWFRAEEGRMVRSFVYMEGKIFEEEGQPIDGEVPIDARCPAEQVAGNWCVNPATLERRTDLGPGLGLVGVLPFENHQ